VVLVRTFAHSRYLAESRACSMHRQYRLRTGSGTKGYRLRSLRPTSERCHECHFAGLVDQPAAAQGYRGATGRMGVVT
jgi:hypothetical protein